MSHHITYGRTQSPAALGGPSAERLWQVTIKPGGGCDGTFQQEGRAPPSPHTQVPVSGLRTPRTRQSAARGLPAPSCFLSSPPPCSRHEHRSCPRRLHAPATSTGTAPRGGRGRVTAVVEEHSSPPGNGTARPVLSQHLCPELRMPCRVRFTIYRGRTCGRTQSLRGEGSEEQPGHLSPGGVTAVSILPVWARGEEPPWREPSPGSGLDGLEGPLLLICSE